MTTKSATDRIAGGSQTADKFVLRLPDGLRDRINLAAARNHRSMNSEMIARIDESLDLEHKYEEVRQFNRYLLNRIEVLEAAAQHHTISLAKSEGKVDQDY